MKDEDLKILIPDDRFLQIGKKRFKVWISGERSLIATEQFNKLIIKGKDENKSITTDYDMYKKYVEISLILIKQDFLPALRNVGISTIFSWLKREKLTADYILKNMDIKELEQFVNDALDPIIGTKKKELEKQEKMAKTMMILVEKLGAEELAELLRSSLQPVDTKKGM